MHRKNRALVLAAAMTSLAIWPAYAQDQGVKVNIDQVSCREMLKMTSDERDFTMIFLHGFMSGKKGQIEFDGPALTEATDQVLDACIGSPDDSLLSVFEKVRS